MAEVGWVDSSDFEETVGCWSRRISVVPRSIAFRKMQGKWGSCSTSGLLTFNVQLLEMDRRFGEEVIVHELLHLVVPNHGRLFRSLFDAYLAEFGDPRMTLKNSPS